MVSRIKQTISLLLLVVYAYIFASTNFFYHSHQLPDGTIVHSHLVGGSKTHVHTSVQLQIIDQLNTATYTPEEITYIQQLFLDCGERQLVMREVSKPFSLPIYHFSLRAPPEA